MNKITFLSLFILALLASSCRTIKETSTEYVCKTDTLYKSLLVQDSIYVQDSIVLREKGDTIFSERWHVKYIERLRTDTLYKSRTDSVYVNVVKEKQMSRLERIRLFLTDAAWVMAVIAMLAAAWYIYRKVFKR